PQSTAGAGAVRPRRRYLLSLGVAGGVVLAAAVVYPLWLARGPELATLRGHRGMVRALAFSADGATLASGGEDHQIRIWDAATGRLRLTMEGHTEMVHGIAFSPDSS